jgi:hypothetical protein
MSYRNVQMPPMIRSRMYPDVVLTDLWPKVLAALASPSATKALTPTLSPAVHSAMPSMLPCALRT